MHISSHNDRIYVAGHRGMVGSAIWRHLQDAGYDNLVGRPSDELDLRDPHATREFFKAEEPDFVVLAAARVGGILANDRYPADFIGDNLAIEQSVIRAAHEVGVDRLIFLGSTCIYPKHADRSLVVRYEDLLDNTTATFRKVAELYGLPSDAETIEAIVEAHRFEKLSGGRTRGKDEEESFFRKGVSGDWKNHFTPELKTLYKEKAGQALIDFGYEVDLDW